MNDNPYISSSSEVIDPIFRPDAGQRPKRVKIAVYLLWISIALQIPQFYLESIHPTGFDSYPTNNVVIYIGVVIFIGFSAFCVLLNVKIFHGRNWARIAVLILTVISLFDLIRELQGVNHHSVTEYIIYCADSPLNILATYFLFSKPGSLWFRPHVQHQSKRRV